MAGFALSGLSLKHQLKFGLNVRLMKDTQRIAGAGTQLVVIQVCWIIITNKISCL